MIVAMRSVAQAGVCSLNILKIAYPARLVDVRMSEETIELRKGL